MTAGAPVVEEIPGVVATPLPAGERTRLLLWVAVPVLVINLAAPYLQLITLPLVFFLKNRLHQTPNQVALFALLAASPTYVGFLFGFIRDRWSPFGGGDRANLVVFGLGAVAAYVALAFAPPAYGVLLAGGVVVGVLMQMVSGAASGIATAIGRRHAMSGQMSTAMNTAIIVPAVMVGWLGGLLADAIEGLPAGQALRPVFLIGAGLMVLVALFGALGPRRVFEDGRIEPEAISPGKDFVPTISRACPRARMRYSRFRSLRSRGSEAAAFVACSPKCSCRRLSGDMQTMEVVKVILSYLLGSVVGGLVVGRLRGGVDIRRLGSGNAGGTNALRTQGKAFAFWEITSFRKSRAESRDWPAVWKSLLRASIFASSPSNRFAVDSDHSPV